MRVRRDPNHGKTDIEVMRDFCKAKGMPTPWQVSGGGTRRVYYERPDRVRVIRGLDVPFEMVGRLSVEAERRGMSNVALAEELGLINQPAPPSLPARIGHRVAELLRIHPSEN